MPIVNVVAFVLATTEPVIELLTLTSIKNVLYVYVSEFAAVVAVSYNVEIVRAVPIKVFAIQGADVKF